MWAVIVDHPTSDNFSYLFDTEEAEYEFKHQAKQYRHKEEDVYMCEVKKMSVKTKKH